MITTDTIKEKAKELSEKYKLDYNLVLIILCNGVDIGLDKGKEIFSREVEKVLNKT